MIRKGPRTCGGGFVATIASASKPSWAHFTPQARLMDSCSPEKSNPRIVQLRTKTSVLLDQVIVLR